MLLKRADGPLNKMLDWINWCEWIPPVMTIRAPVVLIMQYCKQNVLYTSALCHLYHSMLIAKYTVYYPLSTIFWDDSALPL